MQLYDVCIVYAYDYSCINIIHHTVVFSLAIISHAVHFQTTTVNKCMYKLACQQLQWLATQLALVWCKRLIPGHWNKSVNGLVSIAYMHIILFEVTRFCAAAEGEILQCLREMSNWHNLLALATLKIEYNQPHILKKIHKYYSYYFTIQLQWFKQLQLSTLIDSS